MNLLYETLKSNVYEYAKYSIISNEKSLIESLDSFIDDLYSVDNFPNDTHLKRKEMANIYRNLTLLIINDYATGNISGFPNSEGQLYVLINQFYDISLVNPVITHIKDREKDLERPMSGRQHSNYEWDNIIDTANGLSKYWNDMESISVYDVQNNLLEEYPRTGILKYWNYGLDPQYILDLAKSSNDRISKSTYLKSAEKSIEDKYGRDYILHAKYKEPEIYHNLLFDEIVKLQYSYKFEDDHFDNDGLEPIAINLGIKEVVDSKSDF